jgi:putative hydrolase of the HAD superfamily
LISTVFFDWGGVLAESGVLRMRRYWSSAIGVEPADFGAVAEPFMPGFQLGEVSEQEFWAQVCGSLGVSVPDKPLWKAGFRASYVEHAEMLDLARDLHHEGFRVGLISNTEGPAAEFFLEMAASDSRYAVFRNPVFSCDIGRRKPAAAVFAEAARRLESSYPRSVLLDDSQENVQAAVRLGMQAVHVSDVQRAVKELRTLVAAGPDGPAVGDRSV